MSQFIVNEDVVLVDGNDRMTGTIEKLKAHQLGLLHRAFSVFIFNTRGELLLQQRALGKYHSGGKWTNTCCSHQRVNEDNYLAARRRLIEEMGMDCDVQYAFNFIYKADVADGLIEYEYDHVFFGISDEQPVPAPEEVAAWRYLSLPALAEELKSKPADYTEWLKVCFERIAEYYNNTTQVPG